MGPIWGRAQTRAALALCVPLCGCHRRGHHFLLREGQAHKREGGCSPSPSSFPQMPSAAGLLLQYGPRRLSPRPWLAAGLCSALAAFMLGTPPNRLLRLLICLKSSHTSRQRSPRGREKRAGCVHAVLGGGAGAARRSVGPFVPEGPGGLSGGGAARGAPVVRGAGALAPWPLADGALSRRFLPSKQSGSATAAQWQQGWGAGAVPVPSELAHCSLAHWKEGVSGGERETLLEKERHTHSRRERARQGDLPLLSPRLHFLEVKPV